jgi:hypothetical protein
MNAEQEVQQVQMQQPCVDEKPRRKRCQRKKECSYSNSEEEEDYYSGSDQEEVSGKKFEVNADEYREFCRWRRFRERRRMGCPFRRRMFYGMEQGECRFGGPRMPPQPQDEMPSPELVKESEMPQLQQEEEMEQPQYKRRRRSHRRHGRCPPQYAGEGPWGRGPWCMKDFAPPPQSPPFFNGPWGRGPSPYHPQFFGGPWGKKGCPPPPPPHWGPGFW